MTEKSDYLFAEKASILPYKIVLRHALKQLIKRNNSLKNYCIV